MTREEIQRYLPHREPMLLVDEIVVEAEGLVRGRYRIPGDPYFCRGHFPGNPIVPGVILCEIMAQTCAGLMLDALPGHLPVYRGIDEVKFKESVRPGDLCEITCMLDARKADVFFCSVRLEVAGRLCCKGKVTIALLPEPVRMKEEA